MSILPIVIGVDNPMLRTKTKKVLSIDKKLQKLILDMQDTMFEANGIGLAAPQVGQGIRVCIAPIGGKMAALINPEITWKSEKEVVDEEGCLSLPNILLPIPRAKEIVVKYTDQKERPQERKLSDLEARVVQHEVDHLDGVLITDYAAK